MDLQFHKSVCQSLQTVISQTRSTEQTQEIRLPDSLPDVGRVLGSWGQFVVRGKEWRGNGMSVSGGVMVWVLYTPEDESQLCVVDGWVPVQLKWDFPQTQRDGSICIMPVVKCVDARSVSARKLMVRTAVSALGKAMEPSETEVYTTPKLPEDLEIRVQTYPLELPVEAGEKAFQLDEELIFPSSMPPVDKLLRFQLHPEITEHKVLAGRLVFRGNAHFHIFYEAVDGTLQKWNWELPISQYTELDKDYGPGATATIIPIVTALDLNRSEEGKWTLNGGVSAQYIIHDRVRMELSNDAYSPHRSVDLNLQMLDLTTRLDSHSEVIKVHQETDTQGRKILDCVWYPDDLSTQQEENMLKVSIPGQFQMLYLDEDGALQGKSVRTEQDISILSDSQNMAELYLQNPPEAGGEFTADGAALTAEVKLELHMHGQQGIPMITSLSVGDEMQKDPYRPSLILRRAGDQDLWTIARACGSTVSAIQKANALDGDPLADQMLLIPVI